MIPAFLITLSSLVPGLGDAPRGGGGAEEPTLKPLISIALPGVEGRIDHLAYQPARGETTTAGALAGTLHVAALENGTLEVVDLARGVALAPFTWPTQPQGVIHVESSGDAGVTAVADGARGDLLLYEWESQTDRAAVPRRIVRVGDDADNVRRILGTRTLVVGYGDGGLALCDERAGRVTSRIALDGHPESFQIDAAGKRAWVNVPSTRSIAVVDLDAGKVVRSIALKTARQNYPIALSQGERRLLVGCRDPGRLLVFDTDTDALLTELPLSGDVDDVFVDDARKLVYASCGEGFVDVFERTAPGTWKARERVATAAGARTCLFVPERRLLFVAVPHRGEQRAEIRVFSTAP